jgi:hypothetical protein
MLQEIGMISATTPVYHWVISHLHSCLNVIVGANLHKEIFSVTPRNKKEFESIVQKDSESIVGITMLMVCIIL